MTQRNMNDSFLQEAQALWVTEPGCLALKDVSVDAPKAGNVRVRTIASGVSLGTERLVFSGKVPASEWDRMRAPFQDGAFPFPVKYGYASVGEVIDGDPSRVGEVVFALHPHQSLFTLPAETAIPIPLSVPPYRAVLAANMETALNGLWDANASPGDHIAVVGGGVVGLLVAYLAGKLPGSRVTLIDIDPSREAPAHALGVGFANPGNAPRDNDVVFHTSGHPDGLDTALLLAGMEATVVEMSWFGTKAVSAQLGEAFHSRRLTLKSSQVGQIPPARRSRWTYRRRLETALSLLCEPALDVLLSDPIVFQTTPERLTEIFNTGSSGTTPLIVYGSTDHNVPEG